MKNFALIGAAGFIAPRHLKAIHETKNCLLAAADPNDSVGILDQYFPETQFFREIELFDRHLHILAKSPTQKIDYVSICSPNYLHDAHIRLALRAGAHAICEKPLTINTDDLSLLQELENATGKKVYTILQLRLLPALIELKDRFGKEAKRHKAKIDLSYITRRGPWYDASWKADVHKSGGVAMNIGIHFFDLLIWLFGSPVRTELHFASPTKMAGMTELEWAQVRWLLSIDKNDLPPDYQKAGKTAYRSLTVDGEELEFSSGFTDLHTNIYEEILDGRGFGIEDSRAAIQLVQQINRGEVADYPKDLHPKLRN